jgi:hypothetical protein
MFILLAPVEESFYGLGLLSFVFFGLSVVFFLFSNCLSPGYVQQELDMLEIL